MEEIIKVKKEGGIYDCNANVTVDEWKQVLQDTGIATEKVIRILQLYYNEPNHASTSENLKLKYGGTRQSYFVPFTGFCDAVQQKLNRFHVKDTNEKDTYYIIAVTGRYVANRHFEYTLRSELVQAMEELNLTEIKKMTLKDLLNNIDIWPEWLESHNKWVPLFVEEAAKGNDWQDWKKDVFTEYFERSNDQCVSSLRQGYFTNNEKLAIKGQWDKIAPVLQRIAISQDKLNIEEYKELEDIINPLTTQKRKAAIHRMIAGLQPKVLTTIVNEWHLKDVFDLLSETVSDELPTYTGNRYVDSAALQNLIYAQFEGKTYFDIATYSWQIREYLLDSRKNKTQEQPNALEKYTNLLLANKNIVLTGAPGTGKSYLAKRVAEEITKDGGEIGFVQFHPSYDYTDFVEGLRAEEVDSGGVTFTLKNGIFKEFCKKAIARQEVGRSFDELYDDFVTNQIEGLELFTPTHKRPIKFKINSRKSFEVYSEKTRWVIKKDLVRSYVIDDKVTDWKPYTMAIGDKFKELYGTELNKPTSSVNHNKYVFIIDEINRGEISKIFGELFYSIDPGYRGVEGKVKTQYQNLHSYETNTIFDPELGEGWFYVPDNVYIIGTMNDIDRSVESMDFAMRRRFTWVEIDAESRAGMLDGYNWSEEAIGKMLSINSEIEKIDGLGKAYHVGPAYFLKLKSYQDDTATMWDRLWEYHIEPLTKEYLRGMPSAETSLNKLKAAYYGEGQY